MLNQELLKDIKRMGQKIVDLYPKMNKYSDTPFLRLDFGCLVAIDNKMDGKQLFFK